MGETTCGEQLHIAWRDSRGWNLSLVWKSKDQICQIKPENFHCVDETTEENIVIKPCLKLLTQVAEEFGAGTALKDDLLSRRNDLLCKFRLAALSKKTDKPKTTPKATPKAKAKAKANGTAPEPPAKVASASVAPEVASGSEPPANVAPSRLSMYGIGVPFPLGFSHEWSESSSD